MRSVYTLAISTSIGSSDKRCDNCGIIVNRASYINGKFFCWACVGNVVSNWHHISINKLENPCDGCANNPKNDPYASGVCHCTLGAMQYR